MLKKIASVKDIKSLKEGDNIFDKPDVLLAKKFEIARVIADDLIVQYSNTQHAIKLLTRKELLNGNWWMKQDVIQDKQSVN
jgi:hypothetical protein